MSDANRHNHPVGDTLAASNEMSNTWRIHYDVITEAYTEQRYNIKERVIIIDLAKGLLSESRLVASEGGVFACSRHRSPHAGENGGQEARNLYEQAVRAPTLAAVSVNIYSWLVLAYPEGSHRVIESHCSLGAPPISKKP
jgi:hypothetical protein